MTELTNEFSWSKSRDEIFQTCPRQYYFNYYGYWGGWQKDAPERIRQIYLLKNPCPNTLPRNRVAPVNNRADDPGAKGSPAS